MSHADQLPPPEMPARERVLRALEAEFLLLREPNPINLASRCARGPLAPALEALDRTENR